MENLQTKEISNELSYSKKQINPLIEKFHIKPETNSKFKEIILMFKDQTNYQIWAIKTVFNRYASMEQLKAIKDWADENHQLVSKLSKKNIVSYSGDASMAQLFREMEGLNRFNLVKRNINKYNTDQRKIWSEYIGNVSDGEACYANDRLSMLYSMFEKFEKYSDFKQTNFITKCSAIRSADKLIDLLDKCLKHEWDWDREELLDFVRVQTPTTDVVYDDHDVVLLNIKDFDSSAKTCGGNKTSWCITTQPSQFENYITSHNNKQFFMFNFKLGEKDDLSKIGFTVSSKKGIEAAHSMTNRNLLPGAGYTMDNGERTDIYNILNKFKVPFNVFMGISKSSMKYDWNRESLVKFAQANKITIRYAQGNIIVLELDNTEIFKQVMGHTFVSPNNFRFGSIENKAYLIFNFNMLFDMDNSIIACAVRTDDYGTESINNAYNVYGFDMNKDMNEYMALIGLKYEDFLTDISLEPQILLQKYIDEKRVDEAIKLIHENPDMDINYSLHSKTALLSSVIISSLDVFREIVNHPRFNGNIKKEGEDSGALQVLQAYVFSGEEDAKVYREMLDIVLNSGKFDLNVKNATDDTMLTTSIIDSKADWVSKILIKDLAVDINAENEMGETILSYALYFASKDIVDLITKRPDLKIREVDRIAAKERNYNLDELVKPTPSLFHDSRHKMNQSIPEVEVEAPSEKKEAKLSDKDRETIAKIKKLFLS